MNLSETVSQATQSLVPKKQRITLGRIVHYTLSAIDAEAIIASRKIHTGNPVREGDVLPAISVAVWNATSDDPPVNLQVFLDGRDTYWATSRHEDKSPENNTPGTWFFPPRA